ncbi:MAG TPA: hypothetical protein VIK37_00200 [Candidatus Saccharimonadales bacterium]
MHDKIIVVFSAVVMFSLVLMVGALAGEAVSLRTGVCWFLANVVAAVIMGFLMVRDISQILGEDN